tara:strand:- start:486 stop:956 length:471 start_codon:yes stop_codon:yes gene_type:complete
MLENIEILLTVENIYLVVNWGIIPFWLMLVFFPNLSVTNFLVNSVIVPLLLSTAYAYLAYKIFLDGNILSGFNLYNGIEDLYAVFSDELFLLIFWIHFLTLSLFVGAWISRDSQRYNISKPITIISLVITYFSGPVGLLIYWLFRIFFAKKINFNE